MLIRALNTNERAENAGNYTHIAVITADDLTQATAAAAQTINLHALAKGDLILRAFGVPVVPFQNSLDAGFNSDTVSFGSASGGVAILLAATEANANGTFLPINGVTPLLTTAADTLTITVNSMAGKSLSNINRGEYWVFYALFRSSVYSSAVARKGIAKP
jgi:uncharacterized membrane protein